MFHNLQRRQQQLRAHQICMRRHQSLPKPKQQQKEKAGFVLSVFKFIPSMGSSNVCKARKEADILPANVAMNEKIKQLRERWECNMTTCHSEVCFIPAEGPHFALSHDLTEKWAAAIVCSFMTYYDHVHLCGVQ